VVVANTTRADGRWTTLEAHGRHEHKSAAGAVYRAVLRAEVRERLPSVWWREVGRGLFEIEDVPDAVVHEFSRRRIEIEQRGFELTGVPASKLSRESACQGIALATRKAEYGVNGARWLQEPRARAAEHGLGQREIERLRARQARPVDDAAHSTVVLGAPWLVSAYACSRWLGELTCGQAGAVAADRLSSAYATSTSLSGRW